MKQQWIIVWRDYLQATLYACSQIRGFGTLWFIIAPAFCRLKYGIGARDFTIYQLPRVAINDWSQFLRNEPFKHILASQAPARGRQLTDDKLAFYQHCSYHHITTPAVICLLSQSDDAAATVPNLNSANQLVQFLPDGRYFAKPQKGSHGQHAFAFERQGDKVLLADGPCSIESFAALIFQLIHRGIPMLVQPHVLNHPVIRQLTGSPHLSTIRVVSVIEQGEVRAIGSFFRIICGQNQTDNFSHGTSGNLIAAVDVDNGRLLSTKQACNQHWPIMTEVSQHPETGVTLDNFVLPCWPQVLATVAAVHKSMPFLKTVGWDITVGIDAVWVVEANWRYDIDALQVAHTKGFAAVIQPYYSPRGC